MKSLALTLATALALLPSAADANEVVSCKTATGEIGAQFQITSTSSRRFAGALSIALDQGPIELPFFIVSNFKFTRSDFYLATDDPDTNSDLQIELAGTRREANVYRAQLRRFNNGTLIAPVQNLTCTVTPL